MILYFYDIVCCEVDDMAKKNPNQHVLPRKDGWAVKAEGASRATAVLKTKQSAIARAKEIARNHKSKVIVHKGDGRIQDAVRPQTSASPAYIAEHQLSSERALHVLPHKDGWAVQSEGASRPDKVFSSKYLAVQEAHRRAHKLDATMIVHRKDGSFKHIDHPPHYMGPMSTMMRL